MTRQIEVRRTEVRHVGFDASAKRSCTEPFSEHAQLLNFYYDKTMSPGFCQALTERFQVTTGPHGPCDIIPDFQLAIGPGE